MARKMIVDDHTNDEALSAGRVLMVATVPSMIGQFNMDNIRILRELRYEVEVASNFRDTSVWPPRKTLEFEEFLSSQGVRCVQVDYSRSPFSLRKHIKSYIETKSLLKKGRYTFVHTHTPIASAIARIAAHRIHTKVIYTAHGFHFYDGAPLTNWIIFYPVEWFLSRWTDVLITINKEDYRRASDSFCAGRTVYIPGVGVDTARFDACNIDRTRKRADFGINDGDFVLLSVGELSDRKNQRVVLDALGQLNDAGDLDNLVYLLVGVGDLWEDFENLICSYGLTRHVRMLGFRQDVDELCKAADCFVHPSVREGLGIAPLEAMAAGLPLISADVNGIKDYTEDGVSGCCVDPKNVDEMVAAIRKMRDNSSFRLECGENNRRIAKMFDIGNTDAIMRDLYKSLG